MFKKAVFILVTYLFLASVGFAQNRWMLPNKIKENKVKTCSIYKVTPYAHQEKDSLLEKFAALEYSITGKVVSLFSYRNDSSVNYQETDQYTQFDSIAIHIETDFPDLTFYPTIPEKKNSFAMHMYEELHGHNRNEKEIYSYDNKQRLIEHDYYSASFDVKELTEKDCYLKKTFKYNDKGLLTEEKKMTNYDEGEFKFSSQSDYEYNEYGSISKATNKDDKRISIDEYIYNTAGKPLEIRFNIKPGLVPYTDRFTYDSFNNKLSFIETSSDGKAYLTKRYKYKDALLIEESYTNGKGDHKYTTKWKYDANKNVIWEQKQELNGSPYRTSPNDPFKLKLLKYNKDSSFVEEKKYYRKKKKSDYYGKSYYFYNTSKQVIKEKSFDDEDSLCSIFFYEYNTKGQKIKVIEFDKDSLLENVEINFFDSVGVRYARELYQPDNSMQLFQTYKYNKDGKEIGGVFFGGGNATTVKDYFYNSKGLFGTIKIKSDKGIYYYKYAYTYY